MATDILKDIHVWAKERLQKWQVYALEQIITTGYCDTDKLVAMCKEENGISSKEERVDDLYLKDRDDAMLSEANDNISNNETDEKAIRLIAIKKPKNVNKLSPDQELNFEKNGITLIYGDNGSGKSGYGRILKRACATRSKGNKILHNVYEENHEACASADIKISLDAEIKTIPWEDTKSGLKPELAVMCFFDKDCTAFYLDMDNEILITPRNLDLLEKLNRTCNSVRDKLAEEAENLLRKHKPSSLQGTKLDNRPNTEVKTLLTRLNDEPDNESIINELKEEFNNLLPSSESIEKEIQKFRQKLADTPEQLIKQKTILINRLTPLKDALDKVEQCASGEYLIAMRNLISESKVRYDTVKATAALFNKSEFNISNDFWKALWEAAREYSEEIAYPSLTFPVTGPEKRCVLCQQKLQDDASERLIRFEEYIKSEAELAYIRIQEQIEEKFDELNFNADLETHRNTIEEIHIDDEDLARQILETLTKAKLLKEQIRSRIDNKEWDSNPELLAIPKGLHTKIDALKAEIRELEEDENSRNTEELKSDLSLLEEKRELHYIKEDICNWFKRLEINALYKRVCQEISTKNGLMTKKNHELYTSVVTDAFRSNFEDELKELELHDVVDWIEAPSQKGKTPYRITLKNVKGKVKAGDVLSEGEQRGIALALFLAEMKTVGADYPIIFDDPVTSLDHNWRVRFAKRLRAEAMKRQVIIFTHDLVFASFVYDGGKNSKDPRGIRVKIIQLRYNKEKAGIIDERIPWMIKSVNDRIKEIKKLVDETGNYENDNPDIYEEKIRNIYGYLRETWEKSIEDVLFNEIVSRFNKGISSLRLKEAKLHEIDNTSHITPIFDGMTKCSQYLRGHDESPNVKEKLPSIEEINADIAALDEWKKSIIKLRK